jgi:hypothetical protein
MVAKHIETEAAPEGDFRWTCTKKPDPKPGVFRTLISFQVGLSGSDQKVAKVTMNMAHSFLLDVSYFFEDGQLL